MEVAPETPSEPYVGARPFSRQDERLFYGRDEEASELCALIAANSLVVLHAPSGAGKSSLLSAKVQPTLEKANYTVFPIGRVTGAAPALEVDKRDLYSRALLGSIEPCASPQDSLAEVLAAKIDSTLLTFADDRTPEKRRAAETRGFLLIIDQFEELFLAYPESWRSRSAFLSGLTAALRRNKRLTVLLSLREEYLGSLDPLYRELLGLPVARFPLSRLNHEAARIAITQPASAFGAKYADDALDLLLTRLLALPSREPAGAPAPDRQPPLGEYAEPVQLQVVCQYIWAHRTGDMIDVDTVCRFGDVENALGRYYDRCVARCSSHTKIPEGTLRGWIEAHFITDARTRALVRKTDSATEGLPNVVLDELRSLYLLRDEVRGQDTWLELAHDRLVLPVRQSNAVWQEGRGIASPLLDLQRKAASWRGGNETRGLLRGRSLREASEFLALSAVREFGVSTHVTTFVERSMSAEKERRQRAQSVALLIALSMIVLIVGYFLYLEREIALDSQSREIAAYDETARSLEQASDALQPLALAYALFAAVKSEGETNSPAASAAAIMTLRGALKSYGPALRLRPLPALPSLVNFDAKDQLVSLMFTGTPGAGAGVWRVTNGERLWSTEDRVTWMQFASRSPEVAVATLTSKPVAANGPEAAVSTMSSYHLSILDASNHFAPTRFAPVSIPCARSSQLNCFSISNDLNWVAYPTGAQSITLVSLLDPKTKPQVYRIPETSLIWAQTADILLAVHLDDSGQQDVFVVDPKNHITREFRPNVSLPDRHPFVRSDTAISPGGEYVATATEPFGGRTSVRLDVWKIESRKLITSYEMPAPLPDYAWPQLTFSADGSEMAALVGATVALWKRDENTWELLSTPSTGRLTFGAQSQESGFAGVACHDQTASDLPVVTMASCAHWGVLVWNMNTSQSSFTEIEGLNPNPQTPVLWVAPTLDEAAVAFGAGSRAYVKIWPLGGSLNHNSSGSLNLSGKMDELVKEACSRLTHEDMTHVSPELLSRC